MMPNELTNICLKRKSRKLVVKARCTSGSTTDSGSKGINSQQLAASNRCYRVVTQQWCRQDKINIPRIQHLSSRLSPTSVAHFRRKHHAIKCVFPLLSMSIDGMSWPSARNLSSIFISRTIATAPTTTLPAGRLSLPRDLTSQTRSHVFLGKKHPVLRGDARRNRKILKAHIIFREHVVDVLETSHDGVHRLASRTAVPVSRRKLKLQRRKILY